MSILWCGGEDVDFLDSGAVSVNTTGGYFRSNYARCGIVASGGGHRRSKAFPGGAITSGWLGAWSVLYSAPTYGFLVGLVSSSVGTARGLWVGTDSSGYIILVKYDDTTGTTLATSATLYYPYTGAANSHKIDMQVSSYGSSATVNVYIDNGLALTYTGNVTVSGVSNLDAVGLGATFGYTVSTSEMIVATTDTRSMALMTMAPASDGTTNQWTGAASDINETTNNDSTVVTTNTTNDQEQYNITDLPTGTFGILAVKVAARAAMNSATPTGLKLGVNSGGTVGLGSTKTPGTSFGLVEEIFSTNPATSAAWAQSEMNALQVEMKAV